MLVVDVNRSVGKEPGDSKEEGGRTVHPGGGYVLFDLRHCHLNHFDKFSLHMEYCEVRYAEAGTKVKVGRTIRELSVLDQHRSQCGSGSSNLPMMRIRIRIKVLATKDHTESTLPFFS
jgi:hypothetical protein